MRSHSDFYQMENLSFLVTSTVLSGLCLRDGTKEPNSVAVWGDLVLGANLRDIKYHVSVGTGR